MHYGNTLGKYDKCRLGLNLFDEVKQYEEQ